VLGRGAVSPGWVYTSARAPAPHTHSEPALSSEPEFEEHWTQTQEHFITTDQRHVTTFAHIENLELNKVLGFWPEVWGQWDY